MNGVPLKDFARGIYTRLVGLAATLEAKGKGLSSQELDFVERVLYDSCNAISRMAKAKNLKCTEEIHAVYCKLSQQL